jgi:hypothetical protein
LKCCCSAHVRDGVEVCLRSLLYKTEEGRERDQLLKVSGAPGKEGTTTKHEPIKQRRSESAHGRITKARSHDVHKQICKLTYCGKGLRMLQLLFGAGHPGNQVSSQLQVCLQGLGFNIS